MDYNLIAAENTHIENMTDRAIAEETLLHMRALSSLIMQVAPMLAGMENNPMVKMLMRSAGV